MNPAATKPKVILFFADVPFVKLKKINPEGAAIYTFVSRKINSYLLRNPLKEKAIEHGINSIIHDVNQEEKSDYLKIMCAVLLGMIACDKLIYISESVIRRSDARLFLNSLHPNHKGDYKIISIPTTKNE